jgi:hypothetical protein
MKLILHVWSSFRFMASREGGGGGARRYNYGKNFPRIIIF